MDPMDPLLFGNGRMFLSAMFEGACEMGQPVTAQSFEGLSNSLKHQTAL